MWIWAEPVRGSLGGCNDTGLAHAAQSATADGTTLLRRSADAIVFEIAIDL
jgi:hypothetical protein